MYNRVLSRFVGVSVGSEKKPYDISELVCWAYLVVCFGIDVVGMLTHGNIFFFFRPLWEASGNLTDPVLSSICFTLVIILGIVVVPGQIAGVLGWLAFLILIEGCRMLFLGLVELASVSVTGAIVVILGVLGTGVWLTFVAKKAYNEKHKYDKYYLRAQRRTFREFFASIPRGIVYGWAWLAILLNGGMLRPVAFLLVLCGAVGGLVHYEGWFSKTTSRTPQLIVAPLPVEVKKPGVVPRGRPAERFTRPSARISKGAAGQAGGGPNNWSSRKPTSTKVIPDVATEHTPPPPEPAHATGIDMGKMFEDMKATMPKLPGGPVPASDAKKQFP